jgi:hypothetical protein
MEVPDELDFNPEQVRPTGSDEGFGLGQPSFISLGGLVPRGPCGGMHASDVRGFRRRGRSDQLGAIVGHRLSVHRRQVVAPATIWMVW